jgi:hypothetical protein
MVEYGDEGPDGGEKDSVEDWEAVRRVRGAGGGVQGYIRGGFPGGSEVHDRMWGLSDDELVDRFPVIFWNVVGSASASCSYQSVLFLPISFLALLLT